MLDKLSPDPLAAKTEAQKTAAEGYVQLAELEKQRSAEAQVAANGTKGRLITEHKGPNTDPTPGADYKGKSPDDLKKAFGETHAHSIRQWEAGQGVVGPTGSEGNWFYGGFNKPSNSAYELNQKFGYQHDMQATDAELQAKTPEEKKAYASANRDSAIEGFWVLKRTGDLNKAMKRTKEIFDKAGFPVRESY
ncbi:hypothetical protein [Chondromyces crocatus]|uniref:Uncharacterized protein n=1 Tax=Chondromyces crocatus TaxID=52 RepID=A0A0K1EPT5_CHOCO|nr:hypothetical protein [Chondromyces crocatus]AKT42940.1 uncharacterized protein CMC5_071680 [Chondromyces crocatus]